MVEMLPRKGSFDELTEEEQGLMMKTTTRIQLLVHSLLWFHPLQLQLLLLLPLLLLLLLLQLQLSKSLKLQLISLPQG